MPAGESSLIFAVVRTRAAFGLSKIDCVLTIFLKTKKKNKYYEDLRKIINRTFLVTFVKTF